MVFGILLYVLLYGGTIVCVLLAVVSLIRIARSLDHIDRSLAREAAWERDDLMDELEERLVERLHEAGSGDDSGGRG